MKPLSSHLATRPAPRLEGSRQSGFSMVEVLVSMVILSTGLLGVANLQVEALRGNQGAYLSTVAAQQAQDMVERMNANPQGISDNRYDALDSSVPSLVVNCASAACTPAQLAIYDHNRWNSANQALLPSGGGQVHDIGNGVFLVGVTWHDRHLAGAAGWQAGTQAATACGTPAADTRCFVLNHQPAGTS